MDDDRILTSRPEYDQLNWDGVSIKLKVYGLVDDEMMLKLVKLVEAWYFVGAYEGFGGHLHFLDDPQVGNHPDYYWIRWYVDMGSAGTAALDALIASLSGLLKTGRWPRAELSVATLDFHETEEQSADHGDLE